LPPPSTAWRGSIPGARGRTLLLPRLPAPPETSLAAFPCRAYRAPVRQLAHHGLVQQRHADLHAEDVGPELHRARVLPFASTTFTLGITSSAAFCCCALVVLMLLRP